MHKKPLQLPVCSSKDITVNTLSYMHFLMMFLTTSIRASNRKEPYYLFRHDCNFISCLGLLGLATYTAQVRTREIGIRKVLGAGIGNITAMLSVHFLKLVLIAILIATPIAWYAMNKWLQDFAYRIHIQWWLFAITGFLAILIAFATIGYQAIKAAIANPVKSLRTE
jgi:hypothetical protein